MPDRLVLSAYPVKTVENTGIKLVSLPAEAAEKFSKELDITKQIKLLRRSALQGEVSKEVFAQTHQFVGLDTSGDPVFLILSFLFTRGLGPDKGGWFLAIVPSADTQVFKDYLAAAQTHKFAELQHQRALPFYLWTLHGSEYRASYEEVVSMLKDFLINFYHPLWDLYTPIKHLWHLARICGLTGWSGFEAEQRIKKAGRITFTLKEFDEFALQEKLQADKNPGVEIWEEVVKSIATNGKDYFKRLSAYQRRSGYQIPVGHRFLYIAYDRCQIPLEFWRSQAIADYLPTCRYGGKTQINATLIRKWLSQAGLSLTEPPIIKSCNPRTGIVEFDLEAARYHGLPADIC